MMANAKCLRIAAALSVSDAVSLGTATGRNDWTGALCLDREFSGETISPSRSLRHHGDEPRPLPTHPQSILWDSLTYSAGHWASLRIPQATASDFSCFAGSKPIQGDPEPMPRSRFLPAVDPRRQHSRSLSYLSLTLWCVAPCSGWLGGCASPQQGQNERIAAEAAAPARCAKSAGTEGGQRPKKRLRRERWARSQPALIRESRTCPVFR